MARRDPYAVLEVDRDASAVELKRAYRRAALRWHPDRNPDDPQAEARFKEISDAWSQLRDGRRDTYDARQERVRGGRLPEDFLERFHESAGRARDWGERSVVPHFMRWWRGAGAECATRFVRAIDEASDPARFKPHVGAYGRWRARRWLRSVDVGVDEHPRAPLSALYPGRPSRILLGPHALWNADFRETVDLDDAVLRVLLARYAQILAAGRFTPPRDDSDEAWEEAVAAARVRDGRVERAAWLRIGGWAFVAAIIATMMWAGASGW